MIKLPKGTQDYSGESYAKLEYLKNHIESIFKKYHGSFVETPVFERTDILMNKYGDGEKQIYNIEPDNNGQEEIDDIDDIDKTSELSLLDSKLFPRAENVFQERLSLRYDHTVPLVRYCILNGIVKMRRCCFGKVYRRETITRSQVRLREFHQADFDYVGNFDELVPELEIFCMIQELFSSLLIENYHILYNYRQNLDYYIIESGIDHSMFSTVCSSIDKLDKKDREEVRQELKEKGLNSEQINKLYEFLFSSDVILSPTVTHLDLKFKKYINNIKILDKSKIKFSSTLARGSDYYTGIIFEVKLPVESSGMNTNITSSVSGGGRYDKLIPSYKKNEKKKKGKDSEFPMIGFSFGVDRLLPFVKLPESKRKNINIWISSIGKISDPVSIKLDLIGKMIMKGYGVFYNLSNRKFKKEIEDADDNKCNFIIIIGESEWAQGKVSIKNMDTRKQEMVKFEDIDNYFVSIN